MPFLPPPPDSAPRAIIFDIGRVIIRVDLSRWSGTLGAAGKSHLQILRELEADPHWADWQEGRMNPRDFHAHICEKFQLPLDFESSARPGTACSTRSRFCRTILFERLAKKCRLALLSNTDPIHVAHIEAAFPFVRHFPRARVFLPRGIEQARSRDFSSCVAGIGCPAGRDHVHRRSSRKCHGRGLHRHGRFSFLFRRGITRRIFPFGVRVSRTGSACRVFRGTPAKPTG